MKKMKYNKALEELEQIVAEIENEEISIDDLSVKVERASKLIQVCKDTLSKTEKEVENILSSLNEVE